MNQEQREAIEAELEAVLDAKGVDALLSAMVVRKDDGELELVSAQSWTRDQGDSADGYVADVVEAAGNLLTLVWLLEVQVSALTGERHPAIRERVMEIHRQLIRRIEGGKGRVTIKAAGRAERGVIQTTVEGDTDGK